MRRLFDHIDLRVRSLAEAKPFYSAFLPAIGFPDPCETPIGIAYDARRDHPKPEFIGLIEDPTHVPNATRLAFWADTKEEVDRIGQVVVSAGGRNIEGPMFCPEYSPTYYGMFFEDPCGNRLEVCNRHVKKYKRSRTRRYRQPRLRAADSGRFQFPIVRGEVSELHRSASFEMCSTARHGSLR